MNCPMCPGWMGGGMLLGWVVVLAVLVLLVVLILRTTRQ
jgi:hypothetical protein